MDRREPDSPIGRVVHGGVRGVPVRAVDAGSLADRRAGRVGSGGLSEKGLGVHLVGVDEGERDRGTGRAGLRLVGRGCGGVGVGRVVAGEDAGGARGRGVGDRRFAVAGEAAAAGGVVRENREAAGLSADDARLILALRASSLIEGGRLAMLRPERRERLVSMATRLGLRPFDAHLVIAIAQEAARRGERVDGGDGSGRLRLVPMAGHGGSVRGSVMAEVRADVEGKVDRRRDVDRDGGGEWFRLLVAAGLAAVLLIAAVRWLFG